MTEDRAAVDRPVALVTGATGGMGGEIVRDLLRTHRVVAVGRDTDALDALAALGAEPWQVDVTDAAALAARTAARICSEASGEPPGEETRKTMAFTSLSSMAS